MCGSGLSLQDCLLPQQLRMLCVMQNALVVLPSSGAAASASNIDALSSLCSQYCDGSVSSGSSGNSSSPAGQSNNDWGPVIGNSPPPPSPSAGPSSPALPGQQLYSIDKGT